MKGLAPMQSLHNELIWGTAALADAVSWQHVDDEGFGTTVTVMTGAKYWVLARQRRCGDGSRILAGDMGSCTAFGETIEPVKASEDIFEHEGVLLRPGTVL